MCFSLDREEVLFRALKVPARVICTAVDTLVAHGAIQSSTTSSAETLFRLQKYSVVAQHYIQFKCKIPLSLGQQEDNNTSSERDGWRSVIRRKRRSTCTIG